MKKNLFTPFLLALAVLSCALLLGGWELAEPPEDAVREGAFLLCQQSTLHALSEGVEPQMTGLCTLYSYQDAPYLTIGTGFMDITFSIPDRAAEYLHSLLS